MQFNGKCLVGFTYQEDEEGWKLKDNKIDRRLEPLLGRKFSDMLYIALPRIPPNQRPWVHLGLLLTILKHKDVKLDHGPCREIYGTKDGQRTYTAVIEVTNRLEKYRVG